MSKFGFLGPECSARESVYSRFVCLECILSSFSYVLLALNKVNRCKLTGSSHVTRTIFPMSRILVCNFCKLTRGDWDFRGNLTARVISCFGLDGRDERPESVALEGREERPLMRRNSSLLRITADLVSYVASKPYGGSLSCS